MSRSPSIARDRPARSFIFPDSLEQDEISYERPAKEGAPMLCIELGIEIVAY